jgi:DNA-binding CsgD family transcriptional regulator
MNMTSGAGDSAANALIGRERAVDRVMELVTAESSHPGSLLIVGECGAGKSRLLGLAAEQARRRRIRVLAAQGDEIESRQPFASLHQLLFPVLDTVDETWPDHLRETLHSVFGLAPVRPLDPMELRVAVHKLLSGLTRRTPVLLIIDDLQHFDRDSLDVLFFATRRLADEAMSVLFAARGEQLPPGLPTDLSVLSLGPLSEHAAATLLDAQPWSPSGRARMDLLRQAEGNPLAVIELCRAMRAGRQTTPDGVVSPSPRIRHLFAAGLDGLPKDTQRALLYAAVASEREDLAVIMAALGSADLAVWSPAEAVGLVTVVGRRVVFRHSLVRAAVIHQASAQQRHQSHRDLALRLHTEPSRRAWHLAGASIGPDESVAAALEESAGLAQQQGGLFATVRALEEAARLSPCDKDRARRLSKAITAANDFGDPSWVRELYADFLAVNEDPELLGPAACGAAWALSQFSFQREAFELLFDVMTNKPPRSARTTNALLAVAIGVVHKSGLPEHRHALRQMQDQVAQATQVAEAAQVEQTEADAGPERTALYPVLAKEEAVDVHLALTRTVIEPGGQRHLQLRAYLKERPIPGLNGIADTARMNAVGSLAYLADESDVCVDVLRQVIAGLRARGFLAPAVLFTLLAGALLDTGRWAEAEELIDEGSALAAVRKMTHVELDLQALKVTVRALRGHSEPEIVLTGPLWHGVSLDENRATDALRLRARGLHATVTGDHESAFRHLRELFDGDGEPLHFFLSARSIAELATAGQRTGRQEDLAPVLAAVRRQQGARPSTRMTLLMHHAAALIEGGEQAEHHFRLAVANPAADQWPLERAQARLNYAMWLRRQRRAKEARAQLTIVAESAARLGADLLAEQALSELRASGVVVAPSSVDALNDLTAQQRQIVRLAASGLTNREIGEQLFLSPRTIGSHLYLAYPKLGISRRHQLRDVLQET